MLLLYINIIIIEKVEVSSEIFLFYFWNFCESICLNKNKPSIPYRRGYYIEVHPLMGRCMATE
jgi:hypothetical protein